METSIKKKLKIAQYLVNRHGKEGAGIGKDNAKFIDGH